MTKPSNHESIEAATNKPWKEWIAWLNVLNAQELSHSEIANHVHSKLDGTIENPGWWAQNITVAYEQHIGRRKPGQRNDGHFGVSVTKQIAGSKKDVFALWCEAYEHVEGFAGQPISNVRISTTPVRYYWRCDFKDGSRFAVAIEQKTPEKAMIAATHSKLVSEEEAERWRTFWKETLEKL